MSEYWLISAPGDETVEETWKKIEALNKKHKLSEIFKFHIPDLKVGTLDKLMCLSDELGRLDPYIGQVAHQIANYLGELVGSKDKINENLLVGEDDLPTYLTKFKWDSAKFPSSQTTKNIADAISREVQRIEADLKTKSNSYEKLKTDFNNLEKKQTGSLLTRNLAGIVKKEHFVLGSEYLTTILVVVPKSLYKDWKLKYVTLNKMVVPESSELIFENDDSGLFTVTLFRNVVDEFKHAAAKNKFVVRDFCYDEDTLAESQNELNKLRSDKSIGHAKMLRWLKVNFGECFIAWMHAKALRVFVESALRYGLPVNFQAMIIHPQKKNAKRLRDILNDHYAHLDYSFLLHGKFNAYDFVIPGIDAGQSEYYPYVDFPINIDMVDARKF